MINGDVEIIHYGTDIYLIYKGRKLFVDGWVEDGLYTLRMMYLDDVKNKDSIYNFEITNSDKEIVVQEFLNKKIWDGKTFLEEASNIE